MQGVVLVVGVKPRVAVVVTVVVRRGDLLLGCWLLLVVVMMVVRLLRLLLLGHHATLVMLLLRGDVRMLRRLLRHARVRLPVLALWMVWRVSGLRMLQSPAHNIILVLLVLSDPGLGPLRQLLALHPPVLEPDLDLALGELQLAGDLPALLAGDVGGVEELVLEDHGLVAGVGFPFLAAFRFC